MRKALALILAILAVMALCATLVLAEDPPKPTDSKATCTGKAADQEASAKEKATCPFMKKASTAGAKAEACAGMSAEECARKLGYNGKAEFVGMSIKGMTCTGCEQIISGALEKMDGVVKVIEISHKDGSARILCDPTKVKNDALLSTVSTKGYEAQIVPAVATMKVPEKGKVCSPENKAACMGKEKETAAGKTGAEGSK